MVLKYFLLVLFVTLAFADEFHQRKPSQDGNAKYNMPRVINVQEGSRTFWINKAQNNLRALLNQNRNSSSTAKNVIFFLGDGMGFATTATARMHTGKEENFLSFERFPHFGMSKTYCIDRQVADSACSATAFAAGVKANYNTLGVNGNVRVGNCTINDEDSVASITKWAQDAGKGTGIVTTTRITHATPAGFYSHVPRRSYETNEDIAERCNETNFGDIAHQLVHGEEGKGFKVILGGGRRSFRNTTAIDEENRAGYRTDGRDLINEWIEERSSVGNSEYVWHKRDLMSVDVENTDYLLGLFEHDHCRYQQEINDNNLQHQEPSLSEMMSVAIRMLQKEQNGYVLIVEGGRIDHAHHSNYALRNLEETKEFSTAINIARQMTDQRDTLIVVTADHSHVNTYNGYPYRADDVLGFAGRDTDRSSYPSFSYGNGPGYPSTYLENGNSIDRVDLNFVDMRNPSRRSTATVPLSSETHGGEVRTF